MSLKGIDKALFFSNIPSHFKIDNEKVVSFHGPHKASTLDNTTKEFLL